MAKRHRSTYDKYKRKRVFDKNKALIFGVSFLALLIIVGTIVLITSRKKTEEQSNYSQMPPSGLPTITLTYDGHPVNELHGYTCDMDYHYLRENIYVVENTFDIPVNVNLFSADIKAISYMIYDVMNNGLIQSSPNARFMKKGSMITSTLTLDSMIEPSVEYLLDIILTDNTDRDIHYYTRIIRDDATSLKVQLDNILTWTNAIFDPTSKKSEQIVMAQLESDYTIANVDYGLVNLKSSYSHMTWGKLDVSRLSQPVITILDIDDQIGYYRLDYMVKRLNQEVEEYFNISEFYRVRTYTDKMSGDSKTYLLDYERKMDQIFIPSAQSVSPTKAEIGIISKLPTEMMSNLAGNLSCFVVNETLWAMDIESKTFKQIFSFSSSADDVRGNYSQHDIHIIEVSDEGDIDFIVYGYMNSGIHEGTVGIGIYEYINAESVVRERMYIPIDRPFELLKNSIGELFYLSDNNILYLMLDDQIFGFNLETDETSVIADNLTEENHMISVTGKFLAVHEGGKVNDASKIIVYNLESGESYEVNADEETSIKVLGFLNEALVYGVGKTGDLFTKSGKEYLLMSDMYIVNGPGVVQEAIHSDYGYFIDSTEEYNRIIVQKAANTGTAKEPKFTDADDFTIFATDLEVYPELSVSSSYDEARKNIYYVNFVGSTTTAGALNVDRGIEVLFKDEQLSSLSEIMGPTEGFFLYAKGELVDIYENPADAIFDAYLETGVVLASDGRVFYRRAIRPTTSFISDANIETAIKQYKEGNYTDIAGVALTEALYFTGKKIALVWEYNDEMLLLYGYDSNDNLLMMNPDTGEEYVFYYNYIDAVFMKTDACYVIGY